MKTEDVTEEMMINSMINAILEMIEQFEIKPSIALQALFELFLMILSKYAKTDEKGKKKPIIRAIVNELVDLADIDKEDEPQQQIMNFITNYYKN